MSKSLSDPAGAEVERLYRAYYGLVFSYILQQVKCSIHEAEDLTAEVFERAYRNLKGRSEIEAFPKPKSWLIKIAKNVCSKFFLDTGEHEVFSLEHYSSFDREEGAAIDIVENDASRPEHIAERCESCNELNEHFAVLPKEQQRAVYLHYGEGWTFDEISQAYSRSTPRASRTVKSDAHKGMKNLRVR